MKIAFISFEFADNAMSGGIGAYVRAAAAMLAGRGHWVEVFTAGDAERPAQTAMHFAVHTVQASRATFAAAILACFAQRHRTIGFDLIEGPEYGADAAVVAAAFPELPLVVKLHTPRFLIDRINEQYAPWTRRARFMLGGLRRGRLARPYWRYDPEQDPECAHARSATVVTAPSRAILVEVARRWSIPSERLAHVPNAYAAPGEYLAIPAETRTGRVTFVGRLEPRKGVIELAQAIRLVRRAAPAARFRFVGRSLPHPVTGEDMEACLRRILGQAADAVEFAGPVPQEALPAILADTDICIFPSVWEASGYVCLEALAAARGVIASAAGGMAEIIEHGRSGLLAPPQAPGVLAQAILKLLRDPARRAEMGRHGRVAVLVAYAPEVIAPLQEASYARAIELQGARAIARRRSVAA